MANQRQDDLSNTGRNEEQPPSEEQVRGLGEDSDMADDDEFEDAEDTDEEEEEEDGTI